jgi:hypothetical protein
MGRSSFTSVFDARIRGLTYCCKLRITCRLRVLVEKSPSRSLDQGPSFR